MARRSRGLASGPRSSRPTVRPTDRWRYPASSLPTWAAKRRFDLGLHNFEAIADATHGRDVGGVLRLVLDQRAQALDVHVERLGVADVVAAPHAIDENFAGEDASGILEQEAKEGELLLAQFDLIAVHETASRVDVHANVAEGDLLIDFNLITSFSSANVAEGDLLIDFNLIRSLTSTKYGANTSDEFTEPVGLGDVVVGAHFEHQHHVDLFTLGAHDDDRHVARRAH